VSVSLTKFAFITAVAAFFASLALNLTVPLVVLSVMALVDRLLVFVFLPDTDTATVAGHQFGEGDMA
jgi:hypothetical protein